MSTRRRSSALESVLALKTIIALDRRVALVLARAQRIWLMRFMRAVTSLGSAYCCFPAYCALLLVGGGAYGPCVTVVLLAETLLFPLLVGCRYATRRKRPAPSSASAWAPWNRYSFPSYHAARIALLALIVSTTAPTATPFMIALAALIGFSRLLLQKHYLSDVLAGLLAGALAACVALSLYARLQIA